MRCQEKLRPLRAVLLQAGLRPATSRLSHPWEPVWSRESNRIALVCNGRPDIRRYQEIGVRHGAQASA
jgi:hypothetical protein